MGREEFAIILLDKEKDNAFEIAEDLRCSVVESTLPGNDTVKVTISIGISSFGIGAKTFDGLVSSADRALYHAKSQGRNKVCVK